MDKLTKDAIASARKYMNEKHVPNIPLPNEISVESMEAWATIMLKLIPKEDLKKLRDYKEE